MNELKLQLCDILVTVNYKKDLWSRIRRCAVGPHSHVFLYMGKVRLVVHRRQGRKLRFPFLFESNGRGVVLQALSNRYSQEVVVMRLKPEYQKKIPRVLTEAIKLASDEKARYDYWCITRHIIPRIICSKLGLPIPLKYHRNEQQICSECIAEVFWRSNIKILPRDVVPLPGDFTSSSLLTNVWEGLLTADLV